MGFNWTVIGATLPIDLASQITGVLPVANGGTALAAVGTALQGLRTNAAANGLEFAPQQLELLDNHEAASAESTYTFTPGTALSVDDYSMIMVVIGMENTAAFALQAVINAIAGSNNSSDGFRSDGSTLTDITLAATTQLQIASTSIFGGGTNQGFGVIEIYLDDSLSNDINVLSRIGNTGNGRMEYMNGWIVANATTITSITLQTSTSTWRAGGKITTYGLRRA